MKPSLLNSQAEHSSVTGTTVNAFACFGQDVSRKCPKEVSGLDPRPPVSLPKYDQLARAEDPGFSQPTRDRPPASCKLPWRGLALPQQALVIGRRVRLRESPIGLLGSRKTRQFLCSHSLLAPRLPWAPVRKKRVSSE